MKPLRGHPKTKWGADSRVGSGVYKRSRLGDQGVWKNYFYGLWLMRTTEST